ncbi:MAG: hypothetical protein NT027_17170 [Proteobacteria bacterium]|nr:hypothetical protein [Pseudomonadota bacterium]
MNFRISILALLVVSSCGSKDSDDTKTGNVTLNLLPVAPSALGLSDFSMVDGTRAGTFRDLSYTADTTANGFNSLKMYFREVKMCTSLSFPSGTGYTVDGTCATVYSNMTDNYTTDAPTAADRTTMTSAGDGKFYDVMSKTELAKLNNGLAIPVGTYKYGIVETHPWVKMKARSGSLCTRSGSSETYDTGGDGVKTYYSKADSLECPTAGAEESLIYITNANTTFAFLKPFEVKEGDNVILDLAFNLNGEIKSVEGNALGRGVLRNASKESGFYIPMIKMSPAPRLTAESTKTEVYTLGTSASKEQIRIVIYYNSADTTKAIQALNATVLTTASSTIPKDNTPIYSYKATQTGQVVKLSSWDSSDVIEFTRGAAGTATIYCTGTGGGKALEECSGKTTTTLTYAAPTTGTL